LKLDLITRSTDGSLVVTAGVPSSVVDPLGNGIWRQYTNPLPPEAPDGHVILAAVFVQAGCSAITQDDIWMFAGGVTAHQDIPIVTTIRSAAEAEDDKIPSEKATRTQLDTLMPLFYLKTSIGVPGSDTKVVSERALRENFDAKINTSAIVTTIRPSGQAEDTKIPSEKAARDAINDLSNLSSLVHALNSKNPPVDADELFLVDSAASYGPKRLTWSNLKSAMKTYTDTLYAPSSKGVTNGDTHDHYDGDGAQISHGNLLDLSTSDHHTQYLNLSRHDTTSRHTPGTVVPVVTSVGSPGSDSNIPSEKAVRSAVNEKLSVIMTIEVRSVGFSSQVNEFGHGIWVNGSRILEQGRSYGLVVIDRTSGETVFTGTYDVHASSSNAEALADKLASYDQNYIIAIGTYDEPQTNRTTSPLPYQIARCGGSRSLFLSSGFKYRSAYALIGVPGAWEGAGFEAYSGDTDDDTLAYCYLAVLVYSDGSLVKAGPRW